MSREPEGRWTVPGSWVWTSLSELGDIVAGGTPSTKEPAYWADEINWISPADLTGYSAKTIPRGAKSISTAGLTNSSAKVMPAGSVHFSSRAPIGYVVISSEPLATNQGFKSLVPAPGIFNQYVYYYLIVSRGYAHKRASGTTFLEISGKAFGHLPIPLAPTATQHRIVTKIEELFSELDQGVESLKTARVQLNVYRQAVLKHAFEGKLTAQWRKENKDELEKPEQLLARIKQERAARYDHQLQEWKAAVREWKDSSKPGRKPLKPRKPAEMPRLNSAELAKKLPPSPEGHTYTYLDNLGELGRGKSKHRPRNAPELFGGPYPFIQTGEVKAASRIIREHSQTYSELGLEQSKLWPEGTLCITIAANIAETAVLGFDGCFPDSVVGFAATKTLVLPDYVELFIKSVRTRIEAYAPATAQKNINLTTLENLVVPLCSLQEQRVLVAQLKAVLAAIEQNEREIDSALERAELLRQAILKKAFAGQLVAQNPHDEPAAVLLDRIKVEKKQATKKTRKKRIAR